MSIQAHMIQIVQKKTFWSHIEKPWQAQWAQNRKI